ncbi:MAG: porin, partial [Acidaminococcaceae bacterium]
MKKSLVLAMAMALGVTATAFAANPFSDVPAGHWAYGSVAKLAAAGIVDGYPDGTFQGNETMTRYEMAQIVAKALAKGAIGADDKLVAEFANELDNLGVRVAKLEKNADNVKITGQLRAGYKSYDHKKQGDKAEGRTRLYLSGAINDGWTYGAMIENTQNWATNAEENTTKFRRAFVKGNLGGVKVTAGRQYFKVGTGNVADLTGDALKLDFGGKLKATAFFGRFDSDSYVNSTTSEDSERLDTYGLALAYDINKLGLKAAYYKTKDNEVKANMVGDDRSIWNVGADYKFGDVTFGAEYMKASEKDLAGDDTGYAFNLSYKGAKAAQKGSWGAYVGYYD